MSLQDRLDELNVVELPLIHQLGAMGWTHVEGADEDAEHRPKKLPSARPRRLPADAAAGPARRGRSAG